MPLINIALKQSNKKVSEQLMDVQQDIANVDAKVETVSTKLNDSSNGLTALKTAVSTAISNTASSTAANKTGTLSQKGTYTISLLENGTYGLNALKSAVNSITSYSSRGAVKSVQRGNINVDVDESSTLARENGSYYMEVNISRINSNKSIALFNGNGSFSSTASPANGRLFSDTELRVYSNGYNSTSNPRKVRYLSINWQVIEFY